MISAWRLISILLAATKALAVYEIQSDYQSGRDGEHLTERARASFFGRMSFQVLRAFKQLQRETQDAGPLIKKPRVDEEEEDDVEEEVDGRQRLRIDATGRIARVVDFRSRGNLLVELEGPELELDSTRTTLVTFLDKDGNEVAFDDIRRPYDPKLIKSSGSYVDYEPFWKVIRDNDDVMNPWDVRFGGDYAAYDNSDFRYHCTSAYNWERHHDIIMSFGLELRALCDDPESDVPHSRCGELLWACATMRDCFRHCRSPMTVNRHVLNGINSYDKWNEIVILALPKEGWQKKAMPAYRFSGAYSEGPIKPVACLRRDLTDGKEGLDEARTWAAAGHPDVSDSC